MTSTAEKIRQSIEEAVKKAEKELYGTDCEFKILRPKSKAPGELCATAAFVLAGILNENAEKIAESIAKRINMPEGEAVWAEKGYINFRLGSEPLFKSLDKTPKLPEIELPALEAPAFVKIYPAARLAAVLSHRGTPPAGDEEYPEAFAIEEQALLWALFFDGEPYITRAALELYDRLGLGERGSMEARCRYILLNNAVKCMLGKER